MKQKYSEMDAGTKLLWLCIALLIGAILYSHFTSNISSTSLSGSKSTCPSCHRVYSNRADVSSIRKNNMCKNCYKNYKYSEKLKEEVKEQLERK